MKAMKPFYFTHPQYGKLRVVVIGGKIYYCLMDVKNIFKKSVQKLYETIADSEGELKNLNIVMMKDMKIKYNLFFENQEMGKEEAEAENVNADINFCDEQLVKHLVDRRVASAGEAPRRQACCCREDCGKMGARVRQEQTE